MATLEQVQQRYFYFGLEATKYPEIQKCMDKQFKDCLLAGRLGCQVSRDILPFCGKVLRISQLVFDQRHKSPTLFRNWNRIIEYLCQKDGLRVERHNVPPTQLRFPLSRSILKGKDLTFDRVYSLDSSDKEKLERVLKHSLRFTEQSFGYSIFSEKSLRMMLTGDRTLCVYSTTTQGRITAVMWGVKLQIKQANQSVPCFYVLYAAREPEYYGQNIYKKLISHLRPALINKGKFQSEFLCWKQGKNNVINNKSLVKLKHILGDVSRSEGEAYTFEAAENCSVRLNPHSTVPYPTHDALKGALHRYALRAGDPLTFASEITALMFKVKLLWKICYSQTFAKQRDHQNSLQPYEE